MVRKRRAEATGSMTTAGIDNAVFRAVVDHSSIGIILVNQAGTIVLVNQEIERLFGYSRNELIDSALNGLIPQCHRESHDRQRERFSAAAAMQTVGANRDLNGRHKDDREVPVEIGLNPVQAGGAEYMVASVVGISGRWEAERALVERDERFRQLADNISEVFFVMDIEFRETLYISPAYETVWGRTSESVYMDPESFTTAVLPAHREALMAYIARIQAGEHPGNIEFRIRRPNGEEADILSHAVPIRDASGTVYRMAGVALDITERKMAEDALQSNERRLHRLFETVNLIVLELDADARIDYVNPYFLHLVGHSREEVLGEDWFAKFAPPGQEPMMRGVFNDLLRGDKPDHFRNTVVTRSGEERVISWHNIVVRDAARNRTGTLSIGEDMTEYLKLERQFQQAQRMEAVGRLAGGIAHDFNNVLTVISGYSQLLRGSFAEGDARRESTAAIQQAADSAATLTRQLLAFSRQQVLEARVLDLNNVVRGAEKMLRHTIGEDIDLRTILSPQPALIRADAGQLEQVLMNLAVNARDAMPGVGRLVIETAIVDVDASSTPLSTMTPPGAYIRLSATDSGSGMDEATKARIFEPFFTTKDAGKGTGLGLATMYGIVQQSDGFIWAYSEVGYGTTFAIDLPRVDGVVESDAPAAVEAALGGDETLLLVEDAPAVRAIIRQTLERAGYRILEAPNGATAIAVCAEHPESIDLLASDVVMPGMNGRQLAEQLVAMRPGLRVLFVTGYTDDAVMRAGLLDGSVNSLQKPFTPEKLLKAVRRVLDP